MEEKKDYKHFIRIANTDLNGARAIITSLRQIKGVSFMFANMVCHLSGVDKYKRTGDLNDDEIKKINDVIVNPKDYKVPSWMLNRRKDLETGQDRHLISADLTFSTDNDIKMQKMIRSYKGVRHILGQPVRGQRTKSNFRKNKGKVHLGVKTRPGAKSGRT
ncbi:MAG TPA: 30S ribosomal protein S13 [Candidatus Nanoarchaeia archaeon]|nr:30S ribosomal protein S13 [Candidatus Nanoarchaeia archaeon]